MERRRLVTLLAAISAASLAFSPAAGANGGPERSPDATASDHDGDADSREGEVTEDTDDNDGGTPDDVEDDGDNRHPSGKDRSVENGPGNQGKSESDPDGDDNGGIDKPGGDSDGDLADEDGNNGCGNDDDFEDDNNGNCGGLGRGREAADTESSDDAGDEDDAEIAGARADAGDRAEIASDARVAGERRELGSGEAADGSVTATGDFGTEVLGVSLTRGGDADELAVAGATATGATDSTEVLGVAYEAQIDEGSDSLPRTGLNLALAALAGTALVGGGAAMTRARRD